MDDFIEAQCATYERLMTKDIFTRLSQKFNEINQSYGASYNVLSTMQHHRSDARTISVFGSKDTIEKVRIQMEKLIEAEEHQLVLVCDVPKHHMEYLEKIKFFEEIKEEHQLKDIVPFNN